MTKRSLFIIFIILLIVALIGGNYVLAQRTQRQLSTNLLKQSSEHQKIVADEVVKILESEVASVQAKLELIAQIPEVRDAETETCNSKLQEAFPAAKVGNLGRVNKDGVFACSLNNALVGVKAETLGSYIKDIFNDPQHKPVMSRVIKPPGSASYLVAVHIPVYDLNGEFSGSLGGAIYFDELEKKYLQHITFAEQGFVILMDDDGTIMYHTRRELIGKKTSDVEVKSLLTPDDAYEKILVASSQGKSVSEPYHFETEEKLAVFTTVNIFNNRKWIAVVTVPVSEVQNSLLDIGVKRLFQQLIFGSAFLVTILMGAFMTYMVISIFNPIQKITHVAEEVGKGNLNKQIDIQGNDEIGKLARVFNHMIDRLKLLYDSLEDKVEDRTEELTGKVEELEKVKKATLNVLEDLDEQKSALEKVNEQLQQKEQELAEAQEAGGVGSFVWNITDNSIKISAQTYRLYGVPPQSGTTNAQDFLTLVHPEDRESFQKKLVSIQNEITPFELIYRALTPNGQLRWLKARGRTVRSDRGTPLQIVGTVTDITKEREVDRMKTEFISLASHQLRTPLTAIKWFSEMIMDGDVGEISPEVAAQIKNIADSNDRMIELVNSLLNISRIESGRMIIEPVMTDLGELVRQVLAELEPKIQEKHHSVIVSVHPELPKISIDPKLIRQVYMNFLTNAIKYTPPNGEISIFISTKDSEIVSQISDNGYGIPKQQQSRVFEKFYRGDNIIQVETDGTGLGLYLVKAIIESSGGRVWFESHTKEEGESIKTGTSFWFSLPLAGTPAHAGEVSIDS